MVLGSKRIANATMDAFEDGVCLISDAVDT
jgi:hypothetical protein